MIRNFIKSCAALGLVCLCCASAFGDANDELFRLVQSQDSTPEQVLSAIRDGADVNSQKKITVSVNGKAETNRGSVLMAACANTSNPQIIDIIRTLIDEGAYAGAEVEDNKALAFAFAVMLNPKPEIIPLLLSTGIDVNVKVSGKTTPLMLAAQFASNPEIIYTLIRHGADPELKAHNGRTARDFAAQNTNPDMQKVFDHIDAMTDELFSALQDDTATPERIHSLIESGANIHAEKDIPVSALGRSDTVKADALFTACILTSKPEVIRALIDAGADVNKDSPIFAASLFAKNPEVIRELVRAGADINKKTRKTVAPLMVAAGVNPNPEIVRTMILEGADMDVKSEKVFREAVKASGKNPNPAVKQMLTDFEPAYKQMKNMYQELFRAVQNEEAAADDIRRFVAQGANINILGEFIMKSSDGKTSILVKMPLLAAAANINPNPEMIRILVDAGADVNKRYETRGGSAFFQKATILMVACLAGANSDVIQALIDAGADVNARTEKGYTALMYAVSTRRNTPEIIKTLVNAGAKYKLRDYNGKMAIDKALSSAVRDYLASLEK